MTKSIQIRYFALALALGIFTTLPALLQDFQRGLKNYQEFMSGKKKLEQLSPQERSEVILIHQRLKSQSHEGESSSCREAKESAERTASELTDYARRLRNCAEAQNYRDDCSSEFRRVRNAFDDYESSVSSVGSNC